MEHNGRPTVKKKKKSIGVFLEYKIFLARFSSLWSHRNFSIRSPSKKLPPPPLWYKPRDNAQRYELIIKIMISILRCTSGISLACLLTLVVFRVLIPRILNRSQRYTSDPDCTNHRLGILTPLDARVNVHVYVGRHSNHVQEKKILRTTYDAYSSYDSFHMVSLTR